MPNVHPMFRDVPSVSPFMLQLRALNYDTSAMWRRLIDEKNIDALLWVLRLYIAYNPAHGLVLPWGELMRSPVDVHVGSWPGCVAPSVPSSLLVADLISPAATVDDAFLLQILHTKYGAPQITSGDLRKPVGQWCSCGHIDTARKRMRTAIDCFRSANIMATGELIREIPINLYWFTTEGINNWHLACYELFTPDDLRYPLEYNHLRQLRVNAISATAALWVEHISKLPIQFTKQGDEHVVA